MANKHAFKKTSFSFYEKQKIRNMPLLLVLIVTELVLGYFILREILHDDLWGSRGLRAWSLIGFCLLVPSPALLSFVFVRLDSYISEDGIFYRWIPFRKKYHMVQWENIEEISLIDVRNIPGFRRAHKGMDEAEFPGSRFAMVITMKSKRKLLVGTRKAEELNNILRRLAGPKYRASEAEGFFHYD